MKPVAGVRTDKLPPSHPRFIMRLLGTFLLMALPIGADAAAPTVTYLFPAGAQRGTTVEVQAAGSFDAWPVEVWCSSSGVEVRPGKSKGTLEIKVSANAPLGTCWLRLHSAEGASRLCPFVVGKLPEIAEREPNNDVRKPQQLGDQQVVVNGRLAERQDVDHFSLALRKGQTLVASLVANRILGSPMDGVLQVLSPDGFVLAENNDFHGLDPQLAFVVPRDGTYVVRVFAFPATPDSSIRLASGETFIYRLTLTTGGFVDHAFPLAVSRGEHALVRPRGWNLSGASAFDVHADLAVDALPVEFASVANAVAVRVESHRSVVEQEPNDGAKPQAVELPVTISAVIDPPGDCDAFRFNARKGQKLELRVEGRSLDSPLDPVLRLRAAGKLLQEVDDTASAVDPELSFTVPADGAYQIDVRDLHGHGGWRYAYRLRAHFAVPDFSLTVAADTFLGKSGSAEIPVTIVRRNGFAGPVELKVEGVPGGIQVALPKLADNASKPVILKLQTTDKPFRGPIRIVGTALGLSRTARAPLPALGIDTDQLWVTLRPAK